MALYRRYTLLLMTSIFIPAISAAIIGSFFFQPYWGPLTRIGGFLENDYGWNMPQEIFDEPLFKVANNLEEYDHYYDVVVIGDSFSHDEKKGWQNYFVEKTGFSVITLSHAVDLNKLLDSKTFRSNPPRYLVFESLEQFALARLETLSSLNPSKQVSENLPQRALNGFEPNVNVKPHSIGRNAYVPLGSSAFPPLETRIDESFNYLGKTLKRHFLGMPTSQDLRSLWGKNYSLEAATFALPLRRDAFSFFSSKVHDHMLVYCLDIGKQTDNIAIQKAAEGASQMKKSVEANGKTKVMMMIFPDKLSVYAPYLVDPSVAPPSIIPQLASYYPNQLRLDKTFAKAIGDGIQDLYLPDDTHCGYKGYKIAAGQLVDALNTLEGQSIASNAK